MMKEGRDVAVMLCHDAIALFERSFPVSSGKSLVQIVNQDKVGVKERSYFFRHSNTPVKIGREPVG